MAVKPNLRDKIVQAETLARIIREQSLAAQYGDRLKPFLKAAWPAIEPGVAFVDGWHVDCLCEHVEALFARQIRRLIVNISPRSTKSTIISIAAPAWRWIKNPEESFLCGSFDKKLSLNFSRKTRSLIKSPWYQARWGSLYNLTGDQDEKGEFENDKGGYRLATSVEGGVLGRGGSCLHGDSLITTEFGPIPIRAIVEQRMTIRVLGSSGKWRRIRAWSKTRGESGITIKAGNSKLICTDEHPVFIEGKGYIKAEEVVESFYASKSQERGNIFVRGLRQRVLEKSSTRRKGEASFLLPSVFSKALLGAKQPRMGGRKSYQELPAVRSHISDKARRGPKALLDELRREESMGRKALAAQAVSFLRRDVSASNYNENVLLPALREFGSPRPHSGREKRAIYAWGMGQSVRAGVFLDAQRGHQETRRDEMRAVLENSHSSCPPYRRIKDKSRSLQPGDSVYLVPSNGTYKARHSESLDEPVRVDYAERCAAPDFVYNISVEVDEDYYAERILVHNCAIYDDPNDLRKMQFPDYRQSVKDWYSGSASSRHINPKTDVRLCVQQRASYGDDLTAFLLELGGWEHLVIPNEFDGKRPVWPVGNIDFNATYFQDPRTHIGELMCPERMGPEETALQKRESRDNYAGQYQQAPVSDTGGIVKREWFRFYNPPGMERVDQAGNPIPVRIKTKDDETVAIMPVQLPAAFEHVVQAWDMAFKNAEHNDYVAGHGWGRLGANAFLLDREHGHFSFTETKSAVRRLSSRIPCPEKLVEGAANGPAIIDELRNEIPGLIEVDTYGGKIPRFQAISGYIEAGNVYLPNPDLFPWVWDILKECADGRSAEHDDDRDAMSHALKRLYDSMAQSGLPEFRVQPRLGEPQTACHVSREASCPSAWRRMVAIVPGCGAIWMAETPSGSLRVLRELSLDGMDATAAGREIGRLSLPDALERSRQIRDIKRQAYELLFPKEAFAALEPVGCYAEMVEEAILKYEPEQGDWDARQQSRSVLREAHFRADMIEEKDAALDRLRSLLAFQPPDFQKVPYSRAKAHSLAEQDMGQYADYMAAVDGEIRGEWPKLKISPDCKQLIAELGGFRRDRLDEAPPMVRTLLLAVCAPLQYKPREIAIRDNLSQPNRRPGLLGRKFSLGRGR